MSTSKPAYDPNKIPDEAPQSLKENKNFQYFMSHQKEWLEKDYLGFPVIVSNNEHHIEFSDFNIQQQMEYVNLSHKICEEDKTAYKGIIGFPMGARRRSRHLYDTIL